MKRAVSKNKLKIFLIFAVGVLFWTSTGARNFTANTLQVLADVVEVK
jgi:hypothetical protein